MKRLWAFKCLAIAALLCQARAQNEQCSRCHPREAAAHAATRHARALGRASRSLFAEKLPDAPIGEARGGYLLTYGVQGESLLVEARRGGDSATGVIDWVFGAGQQGQTPLMRVGSNFLEHRISYYPKTGRFDLTMGHRSGVSESAREALGQERSREEIERCLSCHATRISENLEPLIPGIQCVRCHPGADEHARGRGRPLNPGQLDASSQLAFCGNCHRSEVAAKDEQDPMNVRFQPLRLKMSRCFLSGGVSCTTCHTAHADAIRGVPEYYNTKCLTCHPGQRENGNCLECHMPRERPHPILSFTDHYIRVVREPAR